MSPPWRDLGSWLAESWEVSKRRVCSFSQEEGGCGKCNFITAGNCRILSLIVKSPGWASMKPTIPFHSMFHCKAWQKIAEMDYADFPSLFHVLYIDEYPLPGFESNGGVFEVLLVLDIARGLCGQPQGTEQQRHTARSIPPSLFPFLRWLSSTLLKRPKFSTTKKKQNPANYLLYSFTPL